MLCKVPVTTWFLGWMLLLTACPEEPRFGPGTLFSGQLRAANAPDVFEADLRVLGVSGSTFNAVLELPALGRRSEVRGEMIGSKLSFVEPRGGYEYRYEGLLDGRSLELRWRMVRADGTLGDHGFLQLALRRRE
ncbi:MAG: hypothetical protein A2284_01780 [Deltaproteobacteria bacterium RIFOXYA12_FULL_61_11]|nr:MAG: hypothetical protein A2284_01780 [Deltaproteobacteria bacterium RIFOXYA12_FULL_61_11]